MNRIRFMLLLALMVILSSVLSHAGSLEVQVGEFSVTGAADKDELKSALTSLLVSRLTGDGITTVDSQAGADFRVFGSYTSFGAVFSIDATVKNAAGVVIGRTFVQGQGADDLIPAVGRLAEQLRPVIKGGASGVVMKAGAKPVEPVAPPVPVVAGAAADSVTQMTTLKGDVVAAPAGDIIRMTPAGQPVPRQTRIDGELMGIAPGRALPGGDRELVLADARKVYLYIQGDGLKKIAEYTIKGEGKALALDTADADNDGQVEVYVTVMDREELKSIALAIGEQGFTPIAERLPYYFRAISVAGKGKQLFAQQIGKDRDDFYGDVCRVIKKGNAFTLGDPVKLPNYANIFSFNRFAAADGKLRTVLVDADGNLRILDESGAELWKGSDRFGGSEVYFQRDEQQMQPLSIDRYRWRFIEQRIEVTADGQIIVPRNSGVMVLGNSRSYSRNSVFGFAWNGASLEERWHTKDSPNYLADFFYDAERKELVILEQVQKSGIFSKGASAISVKKVE